MRRLCVRLLERFLPPNLADHVIGDLMEQQHRGPFWMLRQTLAAIAHLRRREKPGDGIVSTFVSDMRLAVRVGTDMGAVDLPGRDPAGHVASRGEFQIGHGLSLAIDHADFVRLGGLNRQGQRILRRKDARVIKPASAGAERRMKGNDRAKLHAGRQPQSGLPLVVGPRGDFAIELFDGHDEAAVAAARVQWKSCKEAGHAVVYYQQADTGKWQETARA